MGTEETDWLTQCIYLGSAFQTDGLHSRGTEDFLKVNLINLEQCHMTG